MDNYCGNGNTVPDAIKLIILNYLNEFIQTMKFNVDDRLCKSMLNVKDTDNDLFTSMSYGIGDLELFLTFYPNGYSKESMNNTGVYLTIFAELLKHKISKINILFYVYIKELQYECTFDHEYELPLYEWGTGIKTIPKPRLIHTINKHNNITIKSCIKLLNIYDINKKEINRIDWNNYLNINCYNTFNKYTNISPNNNNNITNNDVKMGDIVCVHSLKEQIQFNHLICKVLYKANNNKTNQDVFALKPLNDNSYPILIKDAIDRHLFKQYSCFLHVLKKNIKPI